jgi:hypothetical protein
MDYEARLDLIRDLMGHGLPPAFTNAKALGQYLAAHPETTPATRERLKREVRKAQNKLKSDLFGLSLSPVTRKNVWVKEPDPIRPSHLTYKRRWQPNPLTRIAEQLPRKLPVLSLNKTTYPTEQTD